MIYRCNKRQLTITRNETPPMHFKYNDRAKCMYVLVQMPSMENNLDSYSRLH